jgi:hypothetical protein
MGKIVRAVDSRGLHLLLWSRTATGAGEAGHRLASLFLCRTVVGIQSTAQ